MEIGAVIASDDAEVANGDTGILQQMDIGLLIELSGSGLSAIVFMVADACIDRCLQQFELLMHLLFNHRSHAAINDIASNENQVWLFGIDHFHPTVQFVATVVIADMQVAHRYDLHGLAQLFLCGKLYLLAMLVLIMQIAI